MLSLILIFVLESQRAYVSQNSFSMLQDVFYFFFKYFDRFVRSLIYMIFGDTDEYIWISTDADASTFDVQVSIPVGAGDTNTDSISTGEYTYDTGTTYQNADG